MPSYLIVVLLVLATTVSAHFQLQFPAPRGIVPFFETEGEGLFCFPFNLSAVTNVTSPLKSGENVTLQFVYDGGDGILYQCADLTLSDDATVPSNVSCTNATGSTTTSATASSTTSTSPPSSTNGAMKGLASGIAGLLVLGVTSIIFFL
ncbi:hypothetical protein H0H92_002781 [Tricholoma furcatifolium]|nr:hypothetical protein H0H92_002781 [Tricholoma furcatifolium]